MLKTKVVSSFQEESSLQFCMAGSSLQFCSANCKVNEEDQHPENIQKLGFFFIAPILCASLYLYRNELFIQLLVYDNTM